MGRERRLGRQHVAGAVFCNPRAGLLLDDGPAPGHQQHALFALDDDRLAGPIRYLSVLDGEREIVSQLQARAAGARTGVISAVRLAASATTESAGIRCLFVNKESAGIRW